MSLPPSARQRLSGTALTVRAGEALLEADSLCLSETMADDECDLIAHGNRE